MVASEIDLLPAGSLLPKLLTDYGVMRAWVRAACH